MMSKGKKPSAWRWVERFFAIIGAIASIITIIAWLSGGAIAYPITFVLPVSSVTTTTSVSYATTVTSTVTTARTVPAPFPSTVNVSGYFHAAGLFNTAVNITFSSNGILVPNIHVTGKQYWVILTNSKTYDVQVQYTNFWGTQYSHDCGPLMLAIGSDSTMPPLNWYC